MNMATKLLETKKRVSTIRAKRPRALRKAPALDHIEDYNDPKETKKSLDRALEDLRKGKIHTSL